MLCNVNIWALLVASIASFAVSWIWYSDYVFGKQWRSYMGNLFTVAPSTKDMAKTFSVQFVLTLITNFVLGRALYLAGAHSVAQSVAIAIALWIGFVATIIGSSIIWEKKPWKLVAINTTSYLVSFIVAAIILAAW